MSPIRRTSPPAASTPASCARARRTPSPAGARTPAASSATERRWSDATLVAAGAAFSCGLGKDDSLYCWGDNHYGQLAIGGDTVRPTAAPVPGLAHVGALAAGGAHNCATADDANGARALFCWGANGSSQLGDLSSTDAPAVTRIASLEPVAIAAGRAHTCAFGADKAAALLGIGRLRPARPAAGQRHGHHVTDDHGPRRPGRRRRRLRGGGRRVAHLRGRDDLGVGPLLRPQRRRPARQRDEGRRGRSGPGAVAARQAEDAGGGRRAHLRARRGHDLVLGARRRRSAGRRDGRRASDADGGRSRQRRHGGGRGGRRRGAHLRARGRESHLLGTQHRRTGGRAPADASARPDPGEHDLAGGRGRGRRAPHLRDRRERDGQLLGRERERRARQWDVRFQQCAGSGDRPDECRRDRRGRRRIRARAAPTAPSGAGARTRPGSWATE